MQKYYFNWGELKRHADDDFTGIIILTYAITLKYNILSNSSKKLLSTLKINNIPLTLFRRKYLQYSRGKIFSSYTCKNPQTYFINADFLTANCMPQYKVAYIYMLGLRPISDNKLYIPKEYVDEKHYNNPFIKVQNEKIYFIPELIKHNNTQGDK